MHEIRARMRIGPIPESFPPPLRANSNNALRQSARARLLQTHETAAWLSTRNPQYSLGILAAPLRAQAHCVPRCPGRDPRMEEGELGFLNDSDPAPAT
jgi:hypothetical protein